MLPVLAVAGASLSVAHPPHHVSQGHAFKVKAAPARVRYYLSHDAKRSLEDVQLVKRSRTRLVVPAMPTGSYRLLACAGSQCAASKGTVAVPDGPPTRLQAF